MTNLYIHHSFRLACLINPILQQTQLLCFWEAFLTLAYKPRLISFFLLVECQVDRTAKGRRNKRRKQQGILSGGLENELYTKAQILVTLHMRLHSKNSFKQSPFHPSLTFSHKQVIGQLTADADEYKHYWSNLDCPTEWSWERKVHLYTSNYFHPIKYI